MTEVLVLFADSNVLIEAVFLPRSSDAVVVDMITDGAIMLVTCEQVLLFCGAIDVRAVLGDQ